MPKVFNKLSHILKSKVYIVSFIFVILFYNEKRMNIYTAY